MKWFEDVCTVWDKVVIKVDKPKEFSKLVLSGGLLLYNLHFIS